MPSEGAVIISPEPPKRFSRRTIALVVLILLLVIAGAFVIKKFLIGPPKDVVAIVGKKHITKEEVKTRSFLLDDYAHQYQDFEPTEEQKKQALDFLIDLAVLEQHAAKVGVTIGEKELDEYMNSRHPEVSDYPEFAKKAARQDHYRERLAEKVADRVTAWRGGEYLSFRFQRYYTNTSQYKADKIYAEDLANKYYQKLKNNELTFAQAGEEVRNDSRLGVHIYRTDNYPTKFSYNGVFGRDKLIGEDVLFDIEGIKEYVYSLPRGKVAEPKLLKTHVVNQELYDDGIWIIVRVDEEGDGTHKSFDEWLAEAKKKTKIKIYEAK